jgi:hypothetical protein
MVNSMSVVPHLERLFRQQIARRLMIISDDGTRGGGLHHPFCADQSVSTANPCEP